MKNNKIILSLILCIIIAVSSLIPSFAAEKPFSDEAFASVITASDFQDSGKQAFDRFGRIITLMKNDGLENPDSVLIGGDYSLMLPDYATQGVQLVRDAYTSVYPEADADSVICIQGNHDMLSVGFTKTGFYDMGSYCLYVINEDDYTWKQYKNSSEEKMAALASDIENSLDSMIEAGDTRPVIVITHVPLHHSARSDGRDNLFSSYVFNVLNKAGEKLDIVFLFGHNHSQNYDDYLGGSVNLLQPGDTIRLPIVDNTGEDVYKEETLNFTYGNYGYVGFSRNGTENGSTNVLAVGVIQISKDTLRFVKYTEDGFYCSTDVQRKTVSAAADRTAIPERYNEKVWSVASEICKSDFSKICYVVFNKIIAFFTFLFG